MATTLQQLSVTSPSLPYSPDSNSSSGRAVGIEPNFLPDSGVPISPRFSRPGSYTGRARDEPGAAGGTSDQDDPTAPSSAPCSYDPSYQKSSQLPLHDPASPQDMLSNSTFPQQRPQPVYMPYVSQHHTAHPSSSLGEHMLRRKTPNGILPASYDGNHVTQLGRAHPTKHILYSARPTRVQTVPPAFCDNMNVGSSPTQVLNNRFRPSPLSTPLRSQTIPTPTGLPVHPHHSLTPLSGSVNHVGTGLANNTPGHPPSLLTPLPQLLVPGQNQHISPHFSQRFSVGAPRSPYGLPTPYQQGIIESLLLQTNGGLSPAHVHPQYWGAMAPTIQNALGPTMLNMVGPLSSAWPNNGTLNPFQPAALRDSRYQAEGLSAWSKQAMNQFMLQQQQQHQHQRQQHQQQQHQHQQQQQILLQSSQMFTTSPNGGLHPQTLQGFPYQSNSQLQQAQNPFLSVPYSHSSHLNPIQDNGPFFSHPHVALADQNTIDSVLGQSSNLPLVQPRSAVQPHAPFVIPSGIVPLVSDAEYGVPLRDRVFSWAHMIYLDLLKHVHVNRKNLNGKDGNKPSKLSLYPKPPKLRPSGSSLSRSALSATISQSTDALLSNIVSPTTAWVEGQAAHYEQTVNQGGILTGDWTNSPNGASMPIPLNGVPPLIERVNPDRLVALQHASAISANNLATGAAHLIANNPLAANVFDNQIHASARLALESLTDFIGDTDWTWVEGILLAGCLAYGLLDFSQASKMYQAVLKVDNGHVEAMSNLAATYLAMDRKNDAIQYWHRAIRLRPSHFDAVEHLVGLLCNSQQGRDAVATISFVEDALLYDDNSRDGREPTRSPSAPSSDISDRATFDAEVDPESRFGDVAWRLPCAGQPGFGASGFSVSGSEIHRLIQLIHAKGNMLYALGETAAAARAFESVVLIATGRRPRGPNSPNGLAGLVKHINKSVAAVNSDIIDPTADPILLPPNRAVATARACFPPLGILPGLRHIRAEGSASRAAIATTSNALLSLAKILQDGAASGTTKADPSTRSVATTGGILALYYLSLSLQPSPSTANNVGILLAGVSQAIPQKLIAATNTPAIAGIAPGSGAALALQYYWYGLRLDSRHAHLYTNLGSLLKDAGQLEAAVRMYEQAVQCDGTFDIALANLANAVKDLGRVQEAIGYYWRAVRANPDFAEAVCGLANALGAVCGWVGRGGSAAAGGTRDKWHVGVDGRLLDGTRPGTRSSGWLGRVVALAGRQLRAGESWGQGVINVHFQNEIETAISTIYSGDQTLCKQVITACRSAMKSWVGKRWEGSHLVILVERVCRQLVWRWYQDLYNSQSQGPVIPSHFRRPRLPSNLGVPSTPTVLPFHAFTCPLSARQVRLISQCHGLRVSTTTLQAPWLPELVFPPPSPPEPALRIGYVSSDFNNHPLAHLMQSSFGMHDTRRVLAFCYATTPGDGSIHRAQIEREAPVFRDASSWSSDALVKQIVADGIHILVNLNGYTRGARNEVFAARPAPIQMAFMGFAGTLGAEWCDYLLADEIAVPPSMRRPSRMNMTIPDLLESGTFGDCLDQETSFQNGPKTVATERISEISDIVVVPSSQANPKPETGSDDDPDFDHTSDKSPDSWVYAENIIYCRDTFFCCDHRQSAPDATSNLPWEDEQTRRRALRRQLFPNMPDRALILGNFNQLYKLDPTTFRAWLRILARVPNSVLWLLRFPEAGEQHLRRTATLWAGESVAARIMFTDVAPKQQHIARARICDLFLDTPECNAHTTAADVLWSGTPLLTYGRHPHKMCSRMAGSILRGALPRTPEGDAAALELMAASDEEYEDMAVKMLAASHYDELGRLHGKLAQLRQLIYTSRTVAPLFDTRRWVRDLEDACWIAWDRWVRGQKGDIWLAREPVGLSHSSPPFQFSTKNDGSTTAHADQAWFPSTSMGIPDSKSLDEVPLSNTSDVESNPTGVVSDGQSGLPDGSNVDFMGLPAPESDRSSLFSLPPFP